MSGDPANADPVCDKSPYHSMVTDTIERARIVGESADPTSGLLFRDDENSRLLAGKR